MEEQRDWTPTQEDMRRSPWGLCGFLFYCGAGFCSLLLAILLIGLAMGWL